MAAISDDVPIGLEHVEDDMRIGEGKIIEEEDKEEILEQQLYTFYCHCGQLSMISDTMLKRMPLRKRDKARVIDPNITNAKLFIDNGDTVYIKRPEGLEQQYRKICRKCSVPLMYQHPFSPNISFIFENALLTAEQIGGLSFMNEEKPNKVTLTKHVMNQGKIGSVTVSTVGEEEEDVESREALDSYTKNATIVEMAMKRRGMVQKGIQRPEFAEPQAKRRAGTLKYNPFNS